ncbi:acyl-CoA dehydrogenase, partial [Halorubrum sp. C3]
MLDYFDMELTLSEEERLLVDSARSFIDGEVDDMGQHWIDGTFPTDLIPKMGEMGFYAPNLEGYGLPGVSERAYGLLMRELEACDSGMRSMASVQGALVMYPIHAFGSDEQKEEWLPKLGAGEAVGCFGLTEPEHGSNPSAMETRAEADGDDYVLNGSKTWITNSPIADVAVVWAKDHTEEGTPVRGFLVETDRDGVTTNKIDEKLSLRASITGEISLQDVRVPAENRLPGVSGMKGPLSCL